MSKKLFKHIAAFALTAAVFTAGLPAVTGTDSLFAGWAPLAAADGFYKSYISRSWSEASKKVIDTQATSPAVSVKSKSGGGYYDIGDSLINCYYVSGKVTLGPTLRVSGNTHLILEDGAELYANDGIYIKDGATLHIHAQSDGDNKGKIIAKPSSGPGIGGMSNTVAGNLVIHGGYIDAKGGTNAAGIGGGNHNSGIRSVTIYGGYVKAQGGSSGAGIGEGQQNNVDEKIYIYGGEVHATGGKYGAGIGSGEDRGCGYVYIYGGDVYATGGHDGAGIGGGEMGNGPKELVISGGWVYANGGNNAAGIGGGEHGSGGNITITGGAVMPEGGEKGAGIGGGEDGDGGNITISGGRVNTDGGDQAPGIGGGSTNVGTILINGGEVWSYGHMGGAGIGGSYNRDVNSGSITIDNAWVRASGANEAHEDRNSTYYGAGIGAGANNEKGGDLKISITIRGEKADVVAIGKQGSAGIGAGYCGNMQGTITIDGGTVYAQSMDCNYLPGFGYTAGIPTMATAFTAGTYSFYSGREETPHFGAAIGAGSEGGFGIGGECSGTININGGNVTANISAEVEERRLNRFPNLIQAIGYGEAGSDPGTRNLYDRACVTAGKGYSDSVLVNSDKRISAFTNAYVKIEECKHTNTYMTCHESTHTVHCANCNDETTENHVYRENSNICTVCGHGDPVAVCNIAVMKATTLGAVESEEYSSAPIVAPMNSNYVLPEYLYDNYIENGKKFVGYRAAKLEWDVNNKASYIPLDNTLYKPGDVYTLSADKVVTETVSANNADTDEGVATENVQQYLLWFVPVYAETVDVVYNEGVSSYVDKAAKDYEYTILTHKSSDPAGKGFKGWKSGETEYGEGEVITVTGGMTLTAEYETKPDAHSITVSQCEHGMIYSLPDMASENDNISFSIKAYDGYSIKSVKMNGTELPGTPRTYTASDGEEEESTTTDPDVSESDYTFTMPTADVTITAEFEPISYNISYELNGGTNAAANPATYTVENTVTLADPTPGETGTMFCGWYDNETFKGERITEIPTGSFGDLTLYAKFDSFKITQGKLSLNGDIGVTVGITIPTEYTGEGYYMYITSPRQAAKECNIASAYNEALGMYLFSYNVAAKEMTDSIDFTLKNASGETVYTESISVRKIALSYLANSENYGKEIPVVKAMLNYGAYAQKYFGYRTEAPANAGYEDATIDTITADDLKSYEYNADEASHLPEGVAFKSVYLSMETEMRLNMVVENTTGKELTFSVPDGYSVKTSGSGEKVTVSVTGIKAENIGDKIKVTVSCDGTSGYQKYSPLTYAYNRIRDNDREAGISKAMFRYYIEAKSYAATKSE